MAETITFAKKYRVSLNGKSPNDFNVFVGDLLRPECIMYRWVAYSDGASSDRRILAVTGEISESALETIREMGYDIEELGDNG